MNPLHTGNPEVIELCRFFRLFAADRFDGQLKLLPVEWILHGHLLWTKRNDWLFPPVTVLIRF